MGSILARLILLCQHKASRHTHIPHPPSKKYIKLRTLLHTLETGIERGPTLRSYNLDHLGLIAGMVDELGSA